MKALIFDPSYGCAGDMILGALVDAGASFERIKHELEKLNLSDYSIEMERTSRNQITAVKVHVNTSETHSHRHLSDIKKLIEDSSVSDGVKQDAVAVFMRLAEAEAGVHGTSPEHVHFHEVGAIDAIVDIVGACIAIESLAPDALFSRPVAVGSGMIECAHGRFPVPAPATLNLLKGFPVRMYNVNTELTTPTGAAIVTTLAQPLLGELTGTVLSSGYGAGTREFPDHPNLMRALTLEAEEPWERDTVVEMRTNIDDMNPEVYSHLFEVLFGRKALDVYLTPVSMKKNRPGQLLTVLCNPDDLQTMQSAIFTHTTSSGIRYNTVPRVKLSRRQETVTTSLGDCLVKILEFRGESRVVPEYESVKNIAENAGLSYLEAYNKIIMDLSDIDKE